MHLRNNEFNFSLFNNLKVVESDEVIDINQLIEIIKYGYLKDKIQHLRTITDKKEYDKFKANEIPCITTSGTFFQRRSKNLIEHTGLIQIDIDKVNNYDVLFAALCKDKYTYVGFRSPGGKGIKIIVKIDPNVESHLEQFYSLEKYYKDEYNIEIDKSCKDVSRCMLLSYDPDLYCNPFSEDYTDCYIDPKIITPVDKVINVKYIVQSNSTDKEELIQNITKEIEQNNIDLTDTYENWLRIGFALATELGENGRSYFHRISSHHPEYDSNQSDTFYSNLLNRNNNSISIGTLVHIAREHQVEVQFNIQQKQEKPLVNSAKETSKVGKSLLYQLKVKRLKLAKEESVPAYFIFKDKTLVEMAEKAPDNQEDFMKIAGVGHRNTEKYAQHFIPIIRKHKGISGPIHLKFDENYQVQKSNTHIFNDKEKQLYESLRNLRLQLCREEGLKPYWIFGNSTLNDLVMLKPKTKEELIKIKGLGQKKVDWFGQDIINIMEEILLIHN